MTVMGTALTVEIETAPTDASLSTGETGPTMPVGTPPRRGLGSVAAQLVGRLVHLIVNVASTLAVIRYLDPPQYGDYVVVLTTVMLAVMLADSGLAKLAIREVAQGTVSGRSAIGSVAFLQLVLSAAALLISQLLRQGLDIGVRLFGEVVETASLLLMTAANVAFLALFLAPVIGGSCAAALAFVIGVRSFRMRLSVDRQIIGRFFRDAILVHFGRTAGAATSTLSVMALVPWCSTRAISRTMSLRVPLGSWSTPILSAAATLAVGTLISRTNLPGTAVASLTLGTHLAVNFASHALPLARWASLLAVRPSGPGITIARAAAV